MQNKDGNLEDVNFVKVPLISQSNSAGLGNPIDEEMHEFMNIPSALVEGIKDPFFTYASGDSMTPLIQDGDLLVCDYINNGNPKNGDIVSIVLNGERLVKYFFMTHSSVFLKSLNKSYEDIELLEDDEFFIEGIVCKFQRNLKSRKV